MKARTIYKKSSSLDDINKSSPTFSLEGPVICYIKAGLLACPGRERLPVDTVAECSGRFWG